MILLSHLKTGISASEYAKQFIRTATGEAGASQELVVNPRLMSASYGTIPGGRRYSYTT
jgi:hypothetical protein